MRGSGRERQPAQDVRSRALDLLALREHSTHELREKLRRKDLADAETLETVLAELIAEGLQSDQRYTEAFIRSRRGRGQGPLRIEGELRQRGVDTALIAASLDDDAGPDWSDVARTARCKRFGDTVPADFNERARQARFLRSRGFTERQIRDAFTEGDLS